MKRDRKLSVSAWKSYTRCPRAYYYEKVEKLPESPAAWSARGSAVALALEAWEKSRRTIDIRDSYFSFFDAEIDRLKILEPDEEKWTKTPRVKFLKTDIAKRREEGWGQLETYKDRILAAPWKMYEIDGEPAVEVPLDVWLDNGKDSIRFRGFIDRIIQWPSGVLQIRDEKTGNVENYESDIRQLLAYTVVARDVLKIPVNKAQYWMLKVDRGSKTYDFSSFTLDYLADQILSLDNLIQTGIFLSNPSKKNCDMCPFRSKCPEGSAAA